MDIIFVADKKLNRKMKNLSFDNLVEMGRHYNEYNMKKDMKQIKKLACMDKIEPIIPVNKWSRLC